MEADRYASEEEVWFCTVCGKVSPYDRYGDSKSDRGWDISCCMSSQLISRDTLQTLKTYGSLCNEEDTDNI